MEERAEVCQGWPTSIQQLVKDGYLDGKRIVLAGAQCEQRQKFSQNLAHAVSPGRDGGFEVQDGIEKAQRGDYLFLFADTETDGRQAVPQELLELLPRLRTVGFAALVLITSPRLYGVTFSSLDGQFGQCQCAGAREKTFLDQSVEDQSQVLSDQSVKERGQALSDRSVEDQSQVLSDQSVKERGQALSEQELGYVGHTRPEGIPLFRMRLAEHLFCRLADEEHLPARAVRAEEGLAGEELERMILGAVRVLLAGKDGEVYNLPGKAKASAEQEHPSCEHSPLSPAACIVDTRKVESL